MNNRINLGIDRYLKKKKEDAVVELEIIDYNKMNFYIGLLYNRKINEYKILYIPIDMITSKKIDEYACYQFIDELVVNYILGIFKDYEYLYRDLNFRDRKNEALDNFQIQLNINYQGMNYQLRATEFIPKDWLFMFDIIVTMFEYVPHIVSGFCEDILTLFKDESSYVPYQESFDLQLLRDDDKVIDKFIKGKMLDFDRISYLEEVDGKYFAIIDNHLVIINYNKAGVVRTYCDSNEYNDYIYTIIQAIRREIIKKFSRLMVFENKEKDKAKYYLCYGVDLEGFKVISGITEERLPIQLYKQNNLKIIYDRNDEIKEELANLLNKK